jgi:anti-sigma factor ChrR (cupin superfamily)
MIHQHLQRSAMVAPPVIAGVHLDEDALSAFVEGRLTETESAPVVQHLVGCAFCRRATAELIRLEAETGPAAETALPASEEEPGRIRSLLDKLASRVLPQSEGDSVFAYHAPAEDFKPKTETTPAKEQSEVNAEGDEKQDEEL